MFHFKEKKKKEEQKQLVRKYVELFAILIVSVAIMFGLRTWYLNDQAFKMTIPLLRDTLYEIRSDEVENYIYENANALLYVGVSSDPACRKLEKELKSYIETNALKEEITYLNISNVKDVDAFYHTFNENYQFKDGLSSYPAFVLFKNGKIESVLAAKEDQSLTIDKIEDFLKTNQIEGNKK